MKSRKNHAIWLVLHILLNFDLKWKIDPNFISALGTLKNVECVLWIHCQHIILSSPSHLHEKSSWTSQMEWFHVKITLDVIQISSDLAWIRVSFLNFPGTEYKTKSSKNQVHVLILHIWGLIESCNENIKILHILNRYIFAGTRWHGNWYNDNKCR